MRQIDADALKIAIEDNFIGNSYDINKVIDEQDTLAVPDSDTISRKAAIAAVEFGITYAKAINKETGEVTALFEESNAELQEAADRIKKLPSALPEHIIHCKDCENHLYRDWCRMVQHATSDYSDCAKELYAKRKGEQ